MDNWKSRIHGELITRFSVRFDWIVESSCGCVVAFRQSAKSVTERRESESF